MSMQGGSRTGGTPQEHRGLSRVFREDASYQCGGKAIEKGSHTGGRGAERPREEKEKGKELEEEQPLQAYNLSERFGNKNMQHETLPYKLRA